MCVLLWHRCTQCWVIITITTALHVMCFLHVEALAHTEGGSDGSSDNDVPSLVLRLLLVVFFFGSEINVTL